MSVALRDEVVAFVDTWSGRTGVPLKRLLKWLGLTGGKYYAWKARLGVPNRHNGAQPRHFWLLEWEREAIITFAAGHPLGIDHQAEHRDGMARRFRADDHSQVHRWRLRPPPPPGDRQDRETGRHGKETPYRETHSRRLR